MYVLEERLLFDAALAGDVAAAAAAVKHADATGQTAENTSHQNQSDVADHSGAASSEDAASADSGASAPPDDADTGGAPPETGGDAPKTGGTSPTDHSTDGTNDSNTQPPALSALLEGRPAEGAGTHRTEILVIDASVPDAEAIASAMSGKMEVHIIDNINGTEEVESVLASHPEGVDFLHIVSHGTEGEVVIGGESLRSDTIADHADTLARWGTHLNDDAEIALYGCSVAKGAAGKEFLQSLANATGAEVAASIDDTGADGDWSLEYSTGGNVPRDVLDTPGYDHRLATFTVSNLNDSGPGSLRQAIADANANPGADTITFTTTGTIYPSSQLTISDDLDIVGPGAASLTLNPLFKSRIFYLDDGSTASTIDVGIHGITMRYGFANNGGAIYNNGESLTLDNSQIIYSSALTGAGIYNNSGTIDIYSSHIDYNRGSFGGGIYNLGDININANSSISHNFSSTGGGGGIVTFGGTITLNGGTISYNRAIAEGGGILSYRRGAITLNSGNISNNTAGDSGGGISSWGWGLVKVKGGHIDGNRVIGNHYQYGGGIHMWGGSVEISGGSISHNIVNNYGGGISLEQGGTLTITGGHIDYNRSYGSGGGLFLSKSSNATIARGSISHNRAQWGGGILNNGRLGINGGAIDSNIAAIGGGISNTGSLIIDNGLISNNTAPHANGGGGGVYNTGTLAANGGTISGNTVTNHGGGIWSRGPLSVDGATISNNTATNGDGGGIYFDNASSHITVDNATIRNNAADSGFGGGIYAKTLSFSATNTTFDGNSAIEGGGLYEDMTAAGATETISGGAFTNNTATTYGGGIRVESGANTNFTVTPGTYANPFSTFAGNTAGTAGDDIYPERWTKPATSNDNDDGLFPFNGEHAWWSSGTGASNEGTGGSLGAFDTESLLESISSVPDGEREADADIPMEFNPTPWTHPLDNEALSIPPLPDGEREATPSYHPPTERWTSPTIARELATAIIHRAQPPEAHPAFKSELDYLIAAI